LARVRGLLKLHDMEVKLAAIVNDSIFLNEVHPQKSEVYFT